MQRKVYNKYNEYDHSQWSYSRIKASNFPIFIKKYIYKEKVRP